MSKMTPQDLQCPHCGNEQETMVWDTINVTLDPGLKEKLYAAEINFFECRRCGEKSFINAPLLYHDMSRQFCVQYYPVDLLEDPAFFRLFNSDGSLAMSGIAGVLGEIGAHLTRPHIVFDMNEMISYVEFRGRIAV